MVLQPTARHASLAVRHSPMRWIGLYYGRDLLPATYLLQTPLHAALRLSLIATVHRHLPCARVVP